MENKDSLFQYCLRLGDSSLVIGHRLSEWCGHGPILEEDIAMTNISLDLIGQARIMLTYAGEVEGKGRSEDDLAYLRDAMDFRNLLITEQLNGDFAKTMMRQFFFSTYCYFLYQHLTKSKDSTIAAFAEKSLKEVTYHVRHTSEWIVRLGDGTEESHERAQEAADELWMFIGEMFEMDGVDKEMMTAGIGADLANVKQEWTKLVNDIFKRATLKVPESGYFQKGSKEGKHTEHLGYLLAEMQFLPRAYPGANW
jgi:ring-1,2-phenylacetyl-CoA epoxidase subunit PaaC